MRGASGRTGEASMPAGQPTRRRLLQWLGVAGGSLAGVPGSAFAQADQPAEPSLQVSPAEPGYDDRLTIRVTGLEPGSTVLLTAQATDRDGTTWGAFARFEADEEGRVSPATQTPVSGTYEGLHAMGLVWSMRPAGRDKSIFVPPEGIHELTITARRRGRMLDQRVVRRHFGPLDVRVEDAPNGLVGQLFYPGTGGPFPGVIVLHGSGGTPDRGTALLLAAHGYAVFAPQYFGDPRPLPDQLAEVPVEYLDKARSWMAELDAVAEGQLGLFGTSKGAEYALLGGATYDWAGAVVAIAPSGVVWAGLTQGRERTSSWTLDGEPVDYLPTAFPLEVIADYLVSWPLGEAVSLRPTYEIPLERESQARIEAATIPVEEIDGPVTLVAGGQDALWPSVQLARIAAERLEARETAAPTRFLSYPTAGHGISFPYQPTTGLTAVPGFPPGTDLALGGTPTGLAVAAKRSWPEITATLAGGLR
ncbi:MAG: acyl-CoA thioester hydrolase/BAAT C-terminal domain-containing protein [Halobacteriales archaeon]